MPNINAKAYGRIEGAGSFLVIAVDGSGNFTIGTTTPAFSGWAVPILTEIDTDQISLLITRDSSGNYTSTLDIPSSSRGNVPLIGYAAGNISSILINTTTGIVTAGSFSTTLSGLLTTSYIGQLATGCLLLEDKLTFGATNQMEAGSFHIARSNITWMSVPVPTWYVNHADGAETPLGGTADVILKLEYPLGTVIGTFTWGGLSPATLPDNSNNFSDFLTGLNIPKGGLYGLHLFWSSAAGFLLNNGNDIGSPVVANFARNVAAGEKLRYAASGLTMQATISAITSSDTTGRTGWCPPAIVGPTIEPSLFLLGDSRMLGYHDWYNDTSTNVGYSRAFGPSFGYINAGIFALTTGQYIASHTLKNELAGYCSHIVFELGYNDITSVGSTLTTFLANQQTIFGYFPSKQIFALTLAPGSTSTDSFFTPGNQTSTSKQPNITAYNTLVRSGSVAGLTGYFDFASIAESSLNSGKWTNASISAVFTATHNNVGLVTVSAMTSGAIALLDSIHGAGINTIDQIISFGTGTGQTGTYNANVAFTISSETMFNNAATVDGVHEVAKMNDLYRTSGVVNPALIHR